MFEVLSRFSLTCVFVQVVAALRRARENVLSGYLSFHLASAFKNVGMASCWQMMWRLSADQLNKHSGRCFPARRFCDIAKLRQLPRQRKNKYCEWMAQAKLQSVQVRLHGRV